MFVRWIALAAVVALAACAAPQQSDTAANADVATATDDGQPIADTANNSAPDADLDLWTDGGAQADSGAAVDGVTATDVLQVGDATTEPAPALAPCRGELSAANGWTGQVGYEIFVRSFADSSGDGIGDIKGIISKFDYLNDGKPGGDDLSVTVLWLMPIYPSPSYHGYDVTNYQDVKGEYGNLADLKALVALAHSRGVKVVLDFVGNHTSVQHPWFVDSAAATGHNSWYVWRDTAPEATWKQPWSGTGKVWFQKGKRWYYGVFSPNMPDLNVQDPAVTTELQQAAKFWLSQGIDGFRLDAVRYLVETGPGKGQQDTQATLDWWKSFADFVHSTQAGSLLVGEAWASGTIATKYQAAGLDLTFDFDLQTSLLSAVQGGLGDGVSTVLCQADSSAAPGQPRGTFLSNHDQERWASTLTALDEQKLAESLLFFVSGTPFLYYGEEIGAANGPVGDDKQKRLPMRWDASQNGGFTAGTPWMPLQPGPDVASSLQDPASLLRHVQKLISVWRATPVLQRGSLAVLDAPDGWLLVVRTLGKQRILGVFQLDAEVPPTVPPLAGLGPASTAADLLTYQQVTVKDGRLQLGDLSGTRARWIIVN